MQAGSGDSAQTAPPAGQPEADARPEPAASGSPAPEPAASWAPKPADTVLRIALWAGAALFAIEAAIYVPEVFDAPPETRAFAINSVAKDVLFCALTAIAAADVRRFSRLIGLVIAGHLVIVTLLALAILTGNTPATFPPPRWLAEALPFTDIGESARLIVWLGGAAVATGVLIWLYGRALRARYDLRYLWPIEHETVAAVADCALSSPAVPPREIATAVDHYWASLDVGYKGRLRTALWITCFVPLLYLRPPLPLMSREARRELLERRLLPDVASRKLIGPVRTVVQACVRFAMQMVYLGYYNDRRSHETVGYRRFTQRDDYPGDPAPHKPLRTIPPDDVHDDRLEADVVVVGSGAGGAMAAQALVRRGRRGRRVLILERGQHVDRSEFKEDEALMYSRLYSDGALQTSRDFSFQVLQGMCVGGSTVVNNGICFDIPPDVLASWNGPELDAGLPPGELARSFAEVRRLAGVHSGGFQRPNPLVKRLGQQQGVPGQAPGPGAAFAPVDANIAPGCYGCGYCNIGCRFGLKLSMLDGVLPDVQTWADRERSSNSDFSGALDVLPDCRVVKVLRQGGHATGVRCRLRPPGGREREIEITAATVVVAAGAIHSSRLLMDSGIGGDLVGQGLCANLGSHLTADFGDKDPPLRAFEGLQMSHYLNGLGASDYLIETWFNPVMSQALVMPGWLGDHERNMRRYDRLGVLGVLVGSERNGNHVLRRRGLLNGSDVAFTPSRDDLERLLRGLRKAGEILFKGGATRVMPVTFRYREFHSPAELADLDLDRWVEDASDISVNTGHPQGGNAISRDPAKGVVDERFRVHGFDNLHVCDASVFPTSVRVNPQLTVMALAHRAGSTGIE